MSKGTDTRECPSTEEICALAVGLTSKEDSLRLLEHASGCDDCAEILSRTLQDRLGDADEPPAPEVLHTPATVPSPDSRHMRIGRLWLAIAAALVVGVALWFANRPKESELEELLARASSEMRVHEWRLPGAVHRPVTQERGQSTKLGPAALAQAEAQIMNRSESKKLRGWAYLVRGGFSNALPLLTAAVAESPGDGHAHLLLGVALAGRGGDASDNAALLAAESEFTRALELLPGDGAALFDRASVRWRLVWFEKSRADVDLLCADPKEAQWCQEARQWISRGAN